MSSSGIIELCDHDEIGESNGENVRKEPNSISGASRLKRKYKIKKLQLLESVEDRSSNAFSTAQTNSTVLDQGVSPVDESSLSSTGPIGPAPITRQFWKAGDYDGGQGYHTASQNGKNYLRVHPMFLHSNATSHKWVFGAIAELLDNAVDEIQNGATFVAIDKTSNPRDGSPGLLIQDDGGGMDPEAIRRCMSFGYSDKKLKIAIGQYGNGFKTSSMRLGADAIVFSRHLKNRKQTQSIGLLSYTFLRQMGHDRLVVPMVDYEFNASARTFEAILSNGKEHFSSNLSTLLQWSPYSTAEELLKQWYEMNSDGLEIFCKSWLPPLGVKIKAALCFCHGYGDTCTFVFDGIAKRIAASGYAVYALDHPGFGLSEGLHGYIPSFDGLADNVIENYTKIKGRPEVRGLPHFLLGQSMGGAVAIIVHLKEPRGWDRVVLVAPMCKIATDVTPPEAVLKVGNLLSKVMPTVKFFPQKDLAVLALRDLKNRKMADYNVICYSDRVRLKTAMELLKATSEIEMQLEKVSSPLLILHGAADKVTDPQVRKFLYEKASSKDKTIKLYEEGYHCILEGEPQVSILYEKA